MSTEWVAIIHPDVEGEGRIAASALPTFTAKGWTLVTDEQATGTVKATRTMKVKEPDDGADQPT